MFKGFNLPKGLLESAEGLLKEVNEQDKKFNALLEEYNITTPMQLSEKKQVEFLNRATELLGEGYTGLHKLREAINLREYDGMGGGITQHEKMIQKKVKLGAKLHNEEDELKEASNEAPNIQRLTLTQEEKRKLKEIGSDSAYGLSEGKYSEPADGDKRHLLKGAKVNEEPVESMKQVKMVHQEEKNDDPPFDVDDKEKPTNWKHGGQSRAKWLAKHAMEKARENAKKKVDEESLAEGGMKRVGSGDTTHTYKKKPEDDEREYGVDTERELAVKKYPHKAKEFGMKEAVNEREMTDAEKSKRETIVKSMKKGLAGFKERYGKRAKDVMYATATRQAMKEESEKKKLSEESSDSKKYPMTYIKLHKKEDGEHEAHVAHHTLDLPEVPNNPLHVSSMVKKHPKTKEMKAKGYHIDTYGEHRTPANYYKAPVKVVKEENVKSKVKDMLSKYVPKSKKKNEETVVNGGKTMTGQKMSTVNLDPKMADGVMSGAQVKSGSI